jgi:hypothetical protein
VKDNWAFVGCCPQLLPVRVVVDSKLSARVHITRVHQLMKNITQHLTAPVSLLAEIVGPIQIPANAIQRFTDIAVNVLSKHSFLRPKQSKDIFFEAMEPEEDTHEMVLTFVTDWNGDRVVCDYDRSAYEKSNVEHLLERFDKFANQILIGGQLDLPCGVYMPRSQ